MLISLLEKKKITFMVYVYMPSVRFSEKQQLGFVIISLLNGPLLIINYYETFRVILWLEISRTYDVIYS